MCVCTHAYVLGRAALYCEERSSAPQVATLGYEAHCYLFSFIPLLHGPTTLLEIPPFQRHFCPGHGPCALLQAAAPTAPLALCGAFGFHTSVIS